MNSNDNIEIRNQTTFIQKLTSELIDVYIWFLSFGNMLVKILQ